MATPSEFTRRLTVTPEYYNRRNHSEFLNDFRGFLEASGVPAQYVAKVASYAWEQGHSGGYSEVVNVARDLIYIFKP